MNATAKDEVKWGLIGVSSERVGLTYLLHKNGRFVSFNGAADEVARARTWKTRDGVERFIEREKAAGSNWTYALWPVSVEREACEVSAVAGDRVEGDRVEGDGSALWLSLPDSDEEVISRLQHGDTFTTDQQQAVRLAKRGVVVVRMDRGDDGFKVRDLTEAIERCDDRGWEMRGDPKLNRPNKSVR